MLPIAAQARSQKFAMGGYFGGLRAEPQAAGGQWGSGDLGAEPPALENFAFFLQKYLHFRAILIKN